MPVCDLFKQMNPESQPLKYLDSIIARARLDDANLKVRQKRAGQPVPPGDSWVIYHLEELRKLLINTSTFDEIVELPIDNRNYTDAVGGEACKVSVGLKISPSLGKG